MSGLFPEKIHAVFFFLLLLYLAAISLRDIRERAVSARLLLIGAGTGLAFRLAELGFGMKDLPEVLRLCLPGLIPGLLLLLLNRITGGDPGKGDGLCVLGLGLWLGLRRLLPALLAAGFLLALPGAVGCLIKKKTMKTTLPFLPFLSAAVLFVCLTDGGAALP